ncbi:hypothetical protein TTRE_0000754901, partial [Trichuris trichiura]
PSFPTPSEPTEVETVEITKITTSIKRLITSQRITVNEQPARFHKLVTYRRTESGIEVVFIVRDPRADNTDGTFPGVDPSGSLITSTFTKKLICKGILSLVPGVKDTIKCEEAKDDSEQIDPWKPPTPGSDSVTDPTIVSSEEVTISVQKVMFHETMTINGYYVRLAMESIYSSRCPVAEGVSLVVCKGFLPPTTGGKHTIICSGGDKLTQLPEDSPFIPGESVVSDASNKTHVFELLKKVIYFDRTHLRGYYPRLVSLSGFERAGYQDLQVQFSIAASNCSSLHHVSLEQLYSDICPVNECCSWLTCTGTLPLANACPPGTPPSECSLINYPYERYNGPMLIEFIKNETYNKGTLFNEWLTKITRLDTARRSGAAIKVSFYAAPTECRTAMKPSLKDLYSMQCPLQHEKKWKRCTGIFSMERSRSSVSCGPLVAAEKEDSEVTASVKDEESTLVLMDNVAVKHAEAMRVDEVVKDHIFHSSFFVEGWHVRLIKLEESRRTPMGLFVKFTLAPSLCEQNLTISKEQLYSSSCPIIQDEEQMLCSGIILNRTAGDYRITCRIVMRTKLYEKSISTVIINLEQLYSHFCPVDTNAFTVSCNGTLELNKDGRHEIQCAEEFMTSPAIIVGLVEETEETTITTSIRQMIITEGVKVNGHIAHFDKLIKRKTTETGIEVEFTVTDESYSDPDMDPSESTFETVISESSTHVTYTKKIQCKGILSLVPGVKDIVKCEGQDGDDGQIDPSSPSTETIKYSKLVRKIERLVFFEKMTANGYHVRVNQLTKYEKVDTGIDIAFTIISTRCETKVKVTIDQLYSDMCAPQSFSDPIECKGIMPFQQIFVHHIKCFLPDGTEVPLGPSTSDTIDFEVVETTELTEITTRIKEMMINKKMSIRGHHALLDKLITHKTVDSGIAVEFTITETICDIDDELTEKQLYDPSCVMHVHAKKLICKGIIYNIPGLKDNVQCSERDDVEEFDPSKPATPGVDPTTLRPEEILIAIKKLMFFNAMTINKHHVHVETVTKVEKVTSGAFVEFSIAQTTCSERLTKEPSRPTTPSKEDDEQHSDRYQILRRIRLLAFSEKFSIKGSYARVDSLTKMATIDAGAMVEFSITASACSIRLTITFEQLYSSVCSPQHPSIRQICKGILPSNAHTRHTIKCTDPRGDEESLRPAEQHYLKLIACDCEDAGLHDKPTIPKPGESTPPQKEQDIQITKSIKRLITTQKITIEGKLAAFEKLISHRKTETGIEVEFIVADPNCVGTTEGSSGHKKCTHVKKLRCKGVLSLLPGVKDSVECEEVDDKTEQIDPSLPSTPGSVHTDLTTTDGIIQSVKVLIFIEAMTIKGRHARVEKLIKFEKVTTGVQVEFSIYQTICDGKQKVDPSKPADTNVRIIEYSKVIRKVERLVFMEQMTIGDYYVHVDHLVKYEKVTNGIEIIFTIRQTSCTTKMAVTIDELYSSMCTPESLSDPVVCRGILPFELIFAHEIKCSFPDGTEKPLKPQDPGRDDTEIHETADVAKITTRIKRIMITKKLSVNGQHAHFHSLISHTKVETGIEVEFTVTETSCDTNVELSVEQLYGLSCIQHGYGKMLICKGIISNDPRVKDNIQCSEQDDVDEFDPSHPVTPGTVITIDPRFTESEKIEISIKKLMFAETMTINKHHVRVQKLVRFEKVSSGVHVEFTIVETVCNGKLSIPLENIYSSLCRRKDTVEVVICKGIIPYSIAVKHTVRCSRGDKLTTERVPSPDDQDATDTTEYTKIVRKVERLVFIEKMTINDHYVRVDKLSKYEQTATGVDIEFTIKQTTCTSHVRLLRPQAPGRADLEIIESAELTKITKQIKRMMITKKLAIDEHHARLDTLITHKTVENGIEVEFTITETSCNSNVELTVEQLYDPSCVRPGYGKKLICKGIIFHIVGLEDNVQCFEKDDVDKFDPSQPTKPGRDDVTDPTVPTSEEIVISIKKLMFFEAMTINGYHVRVPLATIYSHHCLEVQTVSVIVCKGLLPLQPNVPHTIRCTDGDKLTERTEPTKPTPGETTTTETVEEIKIITSIKRLIVTQRITVDGSQARFETLISHKKTQTGIQVVFIVTDPNCSKNPGALFDITVSETCTRLGYTKKLVCRGILSLLPGQKDSVKCEDPKDYIQQIDPSQPIRPEDKHTNSITNEIITISVKEILFVETMTIKGRHARVEKLIKYQKVPTGVQVEFSIFETICEGTSKDHPSDPSTRDDTTTDIHTLQHSVVLRKLERLVFIEKMTINGNYVRVVKLTKYERATSGIDVFFTIKQTTCSSQLAPLSTKPTDVGIFETAEVSEITTQIKRMILTKRLTVDGQYARLDTLITHRKVTNGIEVEFTITDTSCNGKLELTVDQVYSHSCSRQTYTKKLVCKAIISLINREYGDVKCSEQDDIEQIDPSKPSNPGEDDITEPSQTVSSEKITISIKELIFSETTTINGHHVRVEKLINYKKVTTGVHVEFTIAETKCSTKLKISLELLYSEHCKNVHGIAVVCEGLLPFRPGIAHTIKCPGVDERTDVEPLKPTTPDGEDTTDKTPVNKEEITLYIKKIMLSEIMTIRGHHVHVEKLIRAQKVTSGVFVEFTILETTCSGRLKKYNPEPSIPSDGDSAQPANKPEIMSKLRLLTFMEKFSIRGHYVRVESLSSAHKVPGGTQVVFTVTATVCTIRIQTSVVDPSRVKKLICKGILSLIPGVKDSIKCEELKETDEEYHKPSFPTPSEPTEAETVEITKISTSIKRLIKSERITVNGQPARFDKLVTHKRTETGIEVVFVVTDPRADNTDRTPSVWDPSVSTFTKKLICKGILSLVPGVKDTIKCEEAKDGDGQYPDPSFPTPSQPTEAEIIEIKKITTSIKRLIKSQRITVNGQPASFDKLVTHKRTESGIEVVFVVTDPRADAVRLGSFRINFHEETYL